MPHLRILPVFLAVLSIASVCAIAKAQDAAAAQVKVSPVPEAAPPKPFPAGSAAPGPVAPIEYRSVDQMSRKDADLEADAESSIAEHAGRIGLDFTHGAWSYRQVVCPALPNHLFLRFLRNGGAGDVSVFTASIPRNGEGRVRIVPIKLRGYSLFSPAPINALTISAFNHIWIEEHPAGTPDWLGTGLCYAALAGAHPELASLVEDLESQKFLAAVPARLEIPVEGGAIVSFTDAGAAPKPMEWTMTFDRRGRLLKAAHLPVGMLTFTSFPPSAGEPKGTPLPPTVDVDSAGGAVAPAKTDP